MVRSITSGRELSSDCGVPSPPSGMFSEAGAERIQAGTALRAAFVLIGLVELPLGSDPNPPTDLRDSPWW